MKKKTIVFGSIIILAIVSLVFVFTQGVNNNANYFVTSEVHNYSVEGEKIKLGFIGAAASKDTLSVTLSITGIDFSTNPELFENLVCIPYISTDEKVETEFVSYAMDQDNPTQITYVYTLRENSYQALHIEMDWTIGPCGPALMESNATPYPSDLLTNYHFTFIVSVK